MAFLAISLALCAAHVAYAQVPPGIEVSLSSPGLNYLITQLVPELEREIGTITIPDINGEKDGFDYGVNNIKCQSFRVSTVAATLAPPSTINVALGDIAVSCTAGWSFKLKVWPHTPSGSGSATVSVSNTNAAATVAMSVSSLRPSLACTSASLNIGNVDVSLSGSAWDWLLGEWARDTWPVPTR